MIDRIDPRRYHHFRSQYHIKALNALEPLRKAVGYEPRNEVIPDRQHVALAKAATWDHRVTVPPGSWLWALSGSSQQAAGFSVQITDFATRSNLFSGAVQYQNLTGQGSVSVLDAAGQAQTISTPLHILPTPRPIIEPAVLNVQLSNLDTANANEVQLVLWILEPPPIGTVGNAWNAQLAAEVDKWRAAIGLAPVSTESGATTPATAAAAAQAPPAPTPNVDPAMLAPAYHRPFNVDDAGDNIIVPGVPGMRIAIHQLALYNTLEQDIRFLDGTGGTDLTGPMADYGQGGALYLPYQSEPHFVLGDNHAFVINLAAVTGVDTTGAVTGFVKYRLFKQWTPGSNS